jgi:hypothetical protein
MEQVIFHPQFFLAGNFKFLIGRLHISCFGFEAFVFVPDV